MNTVHQSEHYGRSYDYLKGSPHLKHRHIYERLTSRIATVVEASSPSSRIPRILEIGAGDGSVTERLLARGYSVTATEMSADSIESMRLRFGPNDRFAAVRDEGDLRAVAGPKFDAVLFASVLHHIPDYISALKSAAEQQLLEGGSLITLQDPLWYPRVSVNTKRLSDAAYMTWRLTQGGLLRGVRTRVRRSFGGPSEEAPGDAVEYHVVRNGVDELAIAELLQGGFGRVEVDSYWSSQGKPQQMLGERLGLSNTFSVFATDFSGRFESR